MRDVISADSHSCSMPADPGFIRFHERVVYCGKHAYDISQTSGEKIMKRPNLFQGAAYTTLALLCAPGANAQSASDEQAEIVVTGIRASQKAAIDVKREAVNTVDAIASEDLGKMP